MAKSDEAASIDPGSCEHLEQAKKGKPRRFVMLYRGSDIVSLVLYKKGAIDKYKKRAKEAGVGQLCFGVVEGDGGTNLSFRLSAADGFDSEPVRETVLKSFLEEQAQLKCKPSFELVEVHGPVLDPDSPLDARFLKARAAGERAIVEHPDRAAELKALIAETASLLDADRDQEAEPKLLALEKQLGRLGARATAASAAAEPVAATVGSKPSVEELASVWYDRTATLPVDLKKLHELKAADLPEIVRLTKEAAELAKQQRYIDAFSILDQAETLIAKAMGAARVAAIPDEILREANRLWQVARAEARAKIGVLQRSVERETAADDDPEEVAKGKAGVQQLGERIDRLDDKLQQLLQSALAETGPERQRWRDEARAQIDTLTRFVSTDPFMMALDDSDFEELTIQKPLLAALSELAKRLA